MLAPERCVLCRRDPAEATPGAFPISVPADGLTRPVPGRVFGLPVESVVLCRCCAQSLVPARRRGGVRVPGSVCRTGSGSERDALEVHAAFVTEETFLSLVHVWKYARVRAVGRAMGAAVALAAPPPPTDGYSLVPVPIDASSRRQRGFNQAEDLARVVGRNLGLPVVADALARVEGHRRQSLAGPGRRRENVRGAFREGPGADRIAGRPVILVDDLVTTGATAREATGILESAGARALGVWCAGITPPDRIPGAYGRRAFPQT